MTTEKKDTTAEDFDTAFGEAVAALETMEVTTKPGTPAATQQTDPADETPAPEKKDETPAPEKKDETPAPEKKVETPAPEKKDETPAPEKKDETPVPEKKDETPVPDPVEVAATRAAQAAAKAIAEEQRRTAEAAETKRVAAETAAAEAERTKIVDPVLSAEDVTAIAEYHKEWPEQSAVVDKLISHELAKQEARFARTLVEVMGRVYKDIQPMADAVSTVETTTFRKAVIDAHPDYDTLDSKLEPWIKAQPAYLQPAYQHVYNDGTAQEFVDLVSDFKKAQGGGTQLPTTPVTPEPPKTPARSAASKDKAASLAPVNAQRTTPAPTGVDQNDFGAAFEEAAAQYK